MKKILTESGWKDVNESSDHHKSFRHGATAAIYGDSKRAAPNHNFREAWLRGHSWASKSQKTKGQPLTSAEVDYAASVYARKVK